jgi:hypothetical protein
MRDAVRGVATLVLRAEDMLAEAGAVIANGFLRLDREEWIRVMEKRSAALQVRSWRQKWRQGQPPDGSKRRIRR